MWGNLSTVSGNHRRETDCGGNLAPSTGLVDPDRLASGGYIIGINPTTIGNEIVSTDSRVIPR
jgi:hypothetical protein